MKIRSYLATVLDGMAKGLFASLIIGVIINRIGILTNIELIENIGKATQFLMGPAIGVGVAYMRKTKQYTIIAAMAAGALGAGTFKLTNGAWTVGTGEPMGALIASLCAVEAAKLIEGRTKFDLFTVPAVIVLIGGILGATVSPFIANIMTAVGTFVNDITVLQPIPMGLLLGIIVGVILTLPISSAALCIAININGLAAGAALAGCCAQMVGFAVISFRENRVGGLFSQGIGTSMLQVPNIIKNPLIWIPPTIASGICGVLASTLFHMETDKVGAGMGTSGLVGQFTTISVMGTSSIPSILILHFLIPAAVSLLIAEFMRRKNWIKPGDMKLS